MRKIIQLILSISFITLLISPVVNATSCKLNTAESILTIPDNITLNPADKGSAGTVLWSKSYSMPDLKYTCDQGIQTNWHSEFSREYLATSIDKVYATEIQGIGIRIKWPVTGTSGNWIPGNSGISTQCSSGCSITGSSVLIEFVQTGTLNQGESYIPAGEIATANVIPTNNIGDKLRIMTINFAAAIKVLTRSCSIFPSTNSLDLGSYSLADFQNSATAQGEKKEFTITMTCPTASSVTLTFSSTISPPFGAGTGVIGVEQGDDYAKNFSIKLFEKNGYVENALSPNKTFTYDITTSLMKTYTAQIYVPASVDRKSGLGAGSVVGAVQYTMTIK